MRVLLDTNVILDLFLNRPGFADDAATLWKANEQGELEAIRRSLTDAGIDPGWEIVPRLTELPQPRRPATRKGRKE